MFASSVQISLPSDHPLLAPITIRHFCGFCDPVQLFNEAVESLPEPEGEDVYDWELSWKQPYSLKESIELPQNLQLPDCTETKIFIRCPKCEFAQQLWPPENSHFLNFLYMLNPHLPISHPEILRYLINGEGTSLLMDLMLIPICFSMPCSCIDCRHYYFYCHKNPHPHSNHSFSYIYSLEFQLSGSCDPEDTRILIEAEQYLADQVSGL